jgi:hypothetical protein
MTIGWGEGIDEAARYLDAKPKAQDLIVVSWYARGSFSYYFSGTSRSIDGIIDETAFQELIEADYAVIYFHQWQRQAPKEFLEFLSDKEPEHSVWINGLEYARVYKLP